MGLPRAPVLARAYATLNFSDWRRLLDLDHGQNCRGLHFSQIMGTVLTSLCAIGCFTKSHPAKKMSPATFLNTIVLLRKAASLLLSRKDRLSACSTDRFPCLPALFARQTITSRQTQKSPKNARAFATRAPPFEVETVSGV